jgi:phosphate:Na+ symporter
MSFRIIPKLIFILALMLLATGPALSESGNSLVSSGDRPLVSLHHPMDEHSRRVSGDGQIVFVGNDIELSARVMGDGVALPDREVSFRTLSPEDRYLGSARSDDKGLVRFRVPVGETEGEVVVMAFLSGENSHESRLVYKLPVKRSSWIVFMLFGLAGGLGLFLFGMDMMSASLQRGAGRRMRGILSALTRNRILGMAVGALVTMVIQSSSATTVVLVSFVQAGLMSFAQTLGVILGADIGTTITAQLIAFKLTDYALLIVALGFFFKYVSKRDRLRGLGDVLLGFGILFFGLSVMAHSMEPLRSYKPFLDVLSELGNPFLGILVGAAFTALIQSSSAFTGIIIVLAQQGFLGLEAGIPLIFGANIGTCVTAGLASLNAGRGAKRVALAHTLFKVFGVLLMLAWIPQFTALVQKISGGATIARQVANAHTVFNVGIALLFLPFTQLIAKLIDRILPDIVETSSPKTRARHLDSSILNAPALALNLAKVEILNMGERVKCMAERIPRIFFERDLDVLDEIHQGENVVDDLDAEISEYLIDIGKQKISEEQAEEVYLMMHVTKQYEHIADIIDKDLRPLARKMVSEGVEFSESGLEEVRAFHIKMLKQIARSLDAFRDGSLDTARKIESKHHRYQAMEWGYRQAHYMRVQKAVTESVASSEYHLDLMDALRQIDNYSTNIARALVKTYESTGSMSDSSG